MLPIEFLNYLKLCAVSKPPSADSAFKLFSRLCKMKFFVLHQSFLIRRHFSAYRAHFRHLNVSYTHMLSEAILVP